jgi:CDP-glycerol glycerophosphotransferase (TagB/SpsB family)
MDVGHLNWLKKLELLHLRPNDSTIHHHTFSQKAKKLPKILSKPHYFSSDKNIDSF